MVYQHNQTYDILEQAEYRGYKYVVVSYGQWPCAYVAIPKGHEGYKHYYDEYPHDIDCHGGLTFAGSLKGHPDLKQNDFWFGWDYAHYDDFIATSYPKVLPDRERKEMDYRRDDNRM